MMLYASGIISTSLIASYHVNILEFEIKTKAFIQIRKIKGYNYYYLGKRLCQAYETTYLRLYVETWTSHGSSKEVRFLSFVIYDCLTYCVL